MAHMPQVHVELKYVQTIKFILHLKVLICEEFKWATNSIQKSKIQIQTQKALPLSFPILS